MGDLEETSDLIDMCSEDDSLLLKSPLRDPLEHHFTENQEHLNATSVADKTYTLEQTDRVPQPVESPEPERTIRTGKYNLRKSLAWDKAFFTNAGVLDAEEISCMMGGVKKGAKKLLPGIQEDVQRSTESISSLESDNLTLESLEADLFEDIRASIQKSSILSKAIKSNNNSGSEEAETQTHHTSKMDLASQSKEMLKSTPRKPLVSRLGSGKTSKHLSACPETPKRASISGVASPSVPKPPKFLGNGSPMSSLTPKRASLGSAHVRKEMDDAKGFTGRGTSVSKTSTISGSRSNAPRPVPIRSSKSSTLGSSIATKIDPRSSCSSFGSSCSVASDSKPKSSLNSIKKKVDLRTANIPSSSLTHKSLSRPKDKNTSGTSKSSAQLKPVTKASSSISPASSISDWSSEPFTSTSNANRRSISARTSLDSTKSGAPQVVSSGSHSNDLGSGSSYSRNGTQATGMLGRGIKKALTGTTTHPALGKPSGLRLPSPKIGFFDGAKSLVRTPNGSTQSSPSGNSNKANLGKLQPPRTVAVKGNTKLDTQRSAKLKSPTPQEPPTASKKIDNAPSPPSMSQKVQKKASPKINEGNHLKREQVEAKESGIAMHINPKVSLSAEDGIELKPSNPQEPMEKNSLPAVNHVVQNNISLETHGENHAEAEVAAKESDIALHNPKLSLIVQDSDNNGNLKEEMSTKTRIPLAVRDSFCNMDDSCDDTTGSTEVEEKKTTTFSFSEGELENS